MPAAAVIRGARALSGITGRKALLGGFVSLVLNPSAQRRGWTGYGKTLRTREVDGTLGVGVKSIDIARNTKSEGSLLVLC